MHPSIAHGRWVALSGSLNLLSEEERNQAELDREAWAKQYGSRDSGFGDAPLCLRFMHEVCEVPLHDAREFLIGHIRRIGSFKYEGALYPDEAARRFVMDSQNVVMAEAALGIFFAAAEGSEWAPAWAGVLQALRGGCAKNYGKRPLLH